MIFSIGKPAQFDEHDLPQPGQCLPHTSGWQFKIVDGNKTEILHTDTLYNCRRIMKACEGLTERKDIDAAIEKTLIQIENEYS